jgi:hypothetical protein
MVKLAHYTAHVLFHCAFAMEKEMRRVFSTFVICRLASSYTHKNAIAFSNSKLLGASISLVRMRHTNADPARAFERRASGETR